MAKALRRYRHVDYSSLLKKLNDPQKEHIRQSYIDNAAPAELMRGSSKREILLRNRQVRYIYSSENHVFHDRDCPCVKDISDENFNVSETIPEGGAFCKVCFRRTILRVAMLEEDLKRLETCVKLVDMFGAKDKDLKTLIVEYKAKLYKVEPNAIYVKVKDDKWFVRESQGRLQLFHNNYIPVGCGQRTMSAGFHLQLECNDFGHIVKCICGYSWEEHAKKSILCSSVFVAKDAGCRATEND